MTDNEIIKALECCTKHKHLCFGVLCPCFDECQGDTSFLGKLVLDLLNRQKAEIERLQKELSEKQEIIKRLCEDGD